MSSRPTTPASLPDTSTWWQQKRAPFIFVTKVAGLMGIYYIILGFPFADRAFEQLLMVNAHASGWLLHLLQPSTLTVGTQIRDAHFAVNVRRGCDAIEPAWLFTTAVIAFPAPMGPKLWGIATGVTAILAINIVRIASLFLIGEYSPGWFEIAHLQVWPLTLIVAAVALWFCWLKFVAARQATASSR
jgi:exosortase/archaeosortase family protein